MSCVQHNTAISFWQSYVKDYSHFTPLLFLSHLSEASQRTADGPRIGDWEILVQWLRQIAFTFTRRTVFSFLVFRYLWVTRFISVKISQMRVSCSRVVYLAKKRLASYGIPRFVAVFTSVHTGPYSVPYDPFYVLIFIFSKIQFNTSLPSIDDLPRFLYLGGSANQPSLYIPYSCCVSRQSYRL